MNNRTPHPTPLNLQFLIDFLPPPIPIRLFRNIRAVFMIRRLHLVLLPRPAMTKKKKKKFFLYTRIFFSTPHTTTLPTHPLGPLHLTAHQPPHIFPCCAISRPSSFSFSNHFENFLFPTSLLLPHSSFSLLLEVHPILFDWAPSPHVVPCMELAADSRSAPSPLRSEFLPLTSTASPADASAFRLPFPVFHANTPSR